MKSTTCTRCNRTYASSQSLWNHKKRCKGSTGQGLKGKIISREDSTLPSQIIPDAEFILTFQMNLMIATRVMMNRLELLRMVKKKKKDLIN